MGDPRKQRKKYEAPKHPWKSERIIEETELCKKYGLKNKKEIWRAKLVLGGFRQQARTLLGSVGAETNKEAQDVIASLNRLGILEGNSLEDVLALTLENLLDRRLQTLVYHMGLANTPKHARQLIIHKHVVVGDNIVNIPKYIVLKKDEDRIHLVEGIPVTKSTKKEKPEVEKEGQKAVQTKGNE